MPRNYFTTLTDFYKSFDHFYGKAKDGNVVHVVNKHNTSCVLMSNKRYEELKENERKATKSPDS